MKFSSPTMYAPETPSTATSPRTRISRRPLRRLPHPLLPRNSTRPSFRSHRDGREHVRNNRLDDEQTCDLANALRLKHGNVGKHTFRYKPNHSPFSTDFRSRPRHHVLLRGAIRRPIGQSRELPAAVLHDPDRKRCPHLNPHFHRKLTSPHLTVFAASTSLRTKCTQAVPRERLRRGPVRSTLLQRRCFTGRAILFH